MTTVPNAPRLSPTMAPTHDALPVGLGSRESKDTSTLLPGFTKEYLLYHKVCPIGMCSDGRLTVAVGPSVVPSGLEDLSIAYRAHIDVREVSSAELISLVERTLRAEEREVEVTRESDSLDGLGADVRDLAIQPPVIRYVNLLIRDAFEAGASDVHLEASPTGLVARYRLDGVLNEANNPAANLQHAVVSRIKLLAELDISERRRPQDGRIRVRLEQRELDVRVSTVPTMHGESVVLRLLDRGEAKVGLDELGLAPSTLISLCQLVSRPHGLILVTGPTGSGKTTTLYAALGRRDARSEKIITVEDPVEYQLTGVTQMPVHAQVGVTFASALRAILRQDPDVVMIGEMRDRETAEIAVQAAMTGHLVLSTLHTNDAIGAIPRLRDLGVPDYLVAATLDGVLAQRLVRRVCPACRVPYEPAAEQVAALARRPVDRATLYRGAGCPSCRGTGFRGRIGLFELLIIDDELRHAMTTGASRAQVRELSESRGLSTLREDGWTKCERGLTTVEEVLRVVQD